MCSPLLRMKSTRERTRVTGEYGKIVRYVSYMRGIVMMRFVSRERGSKVCETKRFGGREIRTKRRL